MKKSLAFLLLSLAFQACAFDSPNDNLQGKAAETELHYALIVIEDGDVTGRVVGCGDAISLLTQSEKMDLNESQKIQKALEKLFSIKEQNANGYYNALYQSDITVDSIQISRLPGKTNTVKVNLNGTLLSGGTCDDPQIQEQILQTISSNLSADAEIEVTIDGKPLSDYFSLK